MRFATFFVSFLAALVAAHGPDADEDDMPKPKAIKPTAAKATSTAALKPTSAVIAKTSAPVVPIPAATAKIPKPLSA